MESIYRTSTFVVLHYTVQDYAGGVNRVANSGTLRYIWPFALYYRGMLGNRFWENSLLTSITFLMEFMAVGYSIIRLFLNYSARNLLTASAIYDVYDGFEQQRYSLTFMAIYRHMFFRTPDIQY